MAPVIIQHCCDPNWPLSTALAKCVDPIFCGSLVFGHCLCVRHYKSPSAAAEVAFLHPNQVSYPQALEQLQWRSRARFNLSAPETNSPSLYPQKIRWSKLVKKRSFGLRPATKYDAAIRLVEKSLNETEVLTENHVWMDDFHCRHCHVWLTEGTENDSPLPVSFLWALWLCGWRLPKELASCTRVWPGWTATQSSRRLKNGWGIVTVRVVLKPTVWRCFSRS